MRAGSGTQPAASTASDDRIRRDFDEIARLEAGDSGSGRYDDFLISLVKRDAARVLDVGCGKGRLTVKAASRAAGPVIGIDLSPEMIAAARARAAGSRVSFVCADFMAWSGDEGGFDCILSAAALHHMESGPALERMVRLLRPGGRLVVHDVRQTSGLPDQIAAFAGLAWQSVRRLITSGRVIEPRRVREAWARHGAGETYLTASEVSRLASSCLPGARVYRHWSWRYTIVWDKPCRQA